MQLVRYISKHEHDVLSEGRSVTDFNHWGEEFPGTTSYGKCFLIGDAHHVKPNDAIGIMRRDRFLSFLSSRACDYDFALMVSGPEEKMMKLFTKEVGTYPNNINMTEYCIQTYSVQLFLDAGLEVHFEAIPHFESGY